MAIPAAEAEDIPVPPPPALGLPGLPEEQAVVGPQPINIDEPEPSGEPTAPPSARHNVPPGLSAPSSMPLDAPPNVVAQPEHREQRAVPTLDPALASLYEPALPGENFLAQRRRHECGETSVLSQVFGRAPNPLRDQQRSSPYAAPPAEDAESYSQVFEVSDLDGSQLPDG